MFFDGLDFSDFWKTSSYAQKFISSAPSDELIREIEVELGYKLPESYIWLMKRQNGGIPKNTHFLMSEKDIEINGIFGIGREKSYSLCGSLGSLFLIREWGYPDIGVIFALTSSGGHEAVFLDYQNALSKEPSVVLVDQEDNYKITSLAENFEKFICGLTEE